MGNKNTKNSAAGDFNADKDCFYLVEPSSGWWRVQGKRTSLVDSSITDPVLGKQVLRAFQAWGYADGPEGP